MIKKDEHYKYQIGDLVEFSEYEFFDEYYNSFERRVGIVIKREFRYVDANQYKIKVDEKNYWIDEDKLTILSKAVKAPAK
jgi:hypothetical protein|tara:strand:+ start:295 stop:534 length:240 start_codon:yes stop_codon:yes gene_type:complete